MIKILNGGRDERSIITSKEYISYLHKYKANKLVIISYAIDKVFNQHFLDTLKNKFKSESIELNVIHSDDSEENTHKIIENCNAIYMCGGIQKLLLNTLKKKDIDLIKNNNIKIVSGGSAGAMVMGTKVIIGRHSVSQIVEGLNFLPNWIIDSHFSERNRMERLQNVLKDYEGYNGCGIDEDTSVVFDENNNIVDVFGKGACYTVIEDTIKKYDYK